MQPAETVSEAQSLSLSQKKVHWSKTEKEKIQKLIHKSDFDMEGRTKNGWMNQWLIMYTTDIPIAPNGNELLFGTCSEIIPVPSSEIIPVLSSFVPKQITYLCFTYRGQMQRESWNFPKIVNYIYGKPGNLFPHHALKLGEFNPILCLPLPGLTATLGQKRSQAIFLKLMAFTCRNLQ